MNLHTRISQLLTDDRLLANLLAAHAVLALILLVSVVLRRLLDHGSDQLVRWTGLHWLDGISKEAKRRGHSFLFWATLGLLGTTVVGSIGYHAGGQDIRADLHAWSDQLTAMFLLRVVVGIVELGLVSYALSHVLRLVRRGRLYAEGRIPDLLPHFVALEQRGSADKVDPDHHQKTLDRWFRMLERLVMAMLVLAAVWCAGHILHLGEVVDRVVWFVMSMITIIMVARLLTLACRTLSQSLAALGNRHLTNSQFRRYWERVTRLFPFGERCFEAAIYVSAASLCVRQLELFAGIAKEFGPRAVLCIGIFFVTRVVIELVQVLLNEAFGMYDEERPIDQKGQTLVPLLQSLCQYALYFGSGVTILSVLGIPTQPILAGAGILGLAGGLGAQSLVTDVVSGFFILFENQYLVGDIIQIGDASGRVEAVTIRHTQVRDEQGRLFIVPNGQIKSVINFSKGFVNAVIDLKVPTASNLEAVIRDLTEAGQRLRKGRREVLADTIVKGVIELTPTDMVVRAVTKVQPGTHVAMQNEFRRLLKEIYDQRKSPSYSELAA